MKSLRNSIAAIAIAIAGFLCSLSAQSDGKHRVACIGNSITYGSAIDDPQTFSYPSQLQNLLGDNYIVGRFGKPGATLLRKGHRPYTAQQEWKDAIDFNPDIAIIHLGINDTDPRNWPNYRDEFISDYLAIIDTLRAANPEIDIYIANLTPIRATHRRFKTGTRDWRLMERETIKDIAAISHCKLIDFETPLRDRQDLLPDGIHPNEEGYLLLAETCRNAILGCDDTLKMPEIFQSGMVLPRDRYLRLHGNGQGYISVEIDGRTYRTFANPGEGWSVTVPPLSAGKKYTLKVSHASDALIFDDIVAGEVWLASGQSNMEFKLRDAIGADDMIAQSADDNIRFYNLTPIAPTSAVEWDSITISETNRLKYFNPGRWEKADPETTGDWSAIAYAFAKQLRDSLDVPVAVISNAVGGSTMESWIDINTIESEMPDMLINWRGNDYVMPWAQSRAKQNSPVGRHPYEPSYLFAAGIRPLEAYPINGVIWYQGESNAHNVELYQEMFPMLVDSWRKEFGNPSLEFIICQLSSINRPSWPHMRNAQRMLAENMPNVEMAVTSDHGDSLDVHPRNKKPIGDRLAKIALNRIYGYDDMEYSGPKPVRAYLDNDKIILEMSHASGLTTSDGREPITFEVAQYDGLYYSADAIIDGDRIIITCDNIEFPKYLRYGWQPFTRANLTNSDSLPASTFKIEVQHNTMPKHCQEPPSPGFEYGLSGCFAGLLMLNNSPAYVVQAGGCNFPTSTPLAPDAKKTFYSDILVSEISDDLFNDSQNCWTKIANLPQPTAYGATAAASDGLVFIGGANDQGSLSNVYLLKPTTTGDEIAELVELPNLLAGLDNAAACAIGNKAYVAGGFLDGKPSKALFCLDLDNLQAGWTLIGNMPGNPRIQPVMAYAVNATGEDCLYIWGGFCPKNGKKEALVETNGLCFNISQGKWHAVDAPKNGYGDEFTLAGGNACTIGKSQIAVLGGVNKDIFEEALRNQAPDYLLHPAEWYKFNDAVCVYDADSNTWRFIGSYPEAARAGASALPHAGITIMGGEIKPRVRTQIISQIPL